MATTKDTVKESIASVDESTLEIITNMQQRIVDAHKEFATTMAKLTPDVPFVPTPDMFDAPDTKSLVEQSFDFQSRLLEANRTFSLGLIDAWSQASTKDSSKK